MKLSIENNEVLCSLDNKSQSFLSACAGLWDGFLNGKLRLYRDKAEAFKEPESVTEWNAERLREVMRNAEQYGVEVDRDVINYNDVLQAEAEKIKAYRRAEKELKALSAKWDRLCKGGCKNCNSLSYDLDLPKCKITGDFLKEKNVPEYVAGIMQLFNLVPFPSENCPYKIKMTKEFKDECLPKAF